MRRRTFLRSAIVAASAAACRPLAGSPASGQQDGGAEGPPTPAATDRTAGPRTRYGDEVPDERRLPQRALGSTGIVVPQLALGGYHLGMHTQERDARALIDLALAEGVRFFDSAEQYQRSDDSRSERWLGAGLAGVRDDVFLMTKTWDPETRSAETARRHLDASLRRLRTDRLDLWQLHAIDSVEDVDRAFAPGAAFEAILAAKEQGLTRFVGVTGHRDPAAHLRALHHFDRGLRFDCVQMPLNPIDAHDRSFCRQVLPALRERGIGVIAMKTAAAGSLVSGGVATPAECLRWVASLPADVIVSGMERPEHLTSNAAALREGPMAVAAADALLARTADRVEPSLETYKRS